MQQWQSRGSITVKQLLYRISDQGKTCIHKSELEKRIELGKIKFSEFNDKNLKQNSFCYYP